jgi:hypothetical protein
LIDGSRLATLLNRDGRSPVREERVMISWTGGCHCGGVRYAITAEAVEGAHCHCTDCQRLSGAGHASHILFPAAALTLSGEVRTYALTADSGNSVTHAFCPTCGAPIWATSSGMPGMISVRAASLDDPERFDPQLAIFTRSARSWDPPVTGLRHFETMPPPG